VLTCFAIDGRAQAQLGVAEGEQRIFQLLRERLELFLIWPGFRRDTRSAGGATLLERGDSSLTGAESSEEKSACSPDRRSPSQDRADSEDEQPLPSGPSPLARLSSRRFKHAGNGGPALMDCQARRSAADSGHDD
jgi:hypothetical protein